MGVLRAAQRNKLPGSSFALPGKRAFPLTDSIHDDKALQLVSRSVKAGNITPAEAEEVRSKARRALGGR